ncbi:MAG: hypothetical protein LBB80_01220 [Treponema sp.]|jgi:hypothetical protein|nr:hypothetical protein [Treponema sp.]
MLKNTKPKRPGNRKGNIIYDKETVDHRTKIWSFLPFKYGKYLVPLIMDNIDFLKTSKKPDFNLTDAIISTLTTISPAQIDRLIKPEQDRLKIQGKNGTRLDEIALFSRIHYTETERTTQDFTK